MKQENSFIVGQHVSSDGNYGVVWKVTEQAVHVRYDNGLFQKFFFNPTHHMQTKIEKLKPLNQ